MSSFSVNEAAEGVLRRFEPLAAIPRPSKHEEAVSAYLADWFAARGIPCERDSAFNVIADIPATPGYENAPLTMLQAHTDMVTVAAPGVSYDPLTDPIRLSREGDTLRAVGTSLGADDGMGVAMILFAADAENGLVHGPLRAVFTADEEQGMSGVNNLLPRHAAGAEYCLNLDSEEVGVITVSSASGTDADYTLTPETAPAALPAALRLSVTGILGGHSGAEIDAGHINGIQALARFLRSLSATGVGFELGSFRGGAARNAIPAFADAVLCVSESDAARVPALAAAYEEGLRAKYAATDPDFTLTVTPTDAPSTVLTEKCAFAALRFAAELPSGVYTMSKKIEGLVESSSSLGVAAVSPEGIYFADMIRSSEQARGEEIVRAQCALAEELGLLANVFGTAAAWPVREGSRLVSIASGAYEKRFGQRAEAVAIHAGLECGSFAALNGDLDIISIGPDSHAIHSPEESVDLPSVGKCMLWVADILAEIAEERR